ncbi:MAG: ABC transporter ATP-binding protein, partial [Clostridia bacterium]|nr:ABC transporter ATP-binding protein [Clostridia bacterium]
MKKTYSSLVKFFALFRSRLPAYGLSSLIVSGRNFLLTWLTAFIGSEVIAAVETGAVANFGSRLLVFALILLLYALTDTLGLYLLGVTSQKIENDVRLGALRGVLFANFSKAQSLGGRGEILSRIDKDTGSAVGLLSGGFVTVAMFVISGVGATAVIARESLLVCGALYLLGVAGFFLQNYLSSQVKKLTKAQRESGSRAMSKFIQLLSRSADIKASGNCARGFALYGAEIENFRKISAKLSLISGISDGVSEAVLLIGFWGSLGFCVYRYYLGDGSLESAVMVSQMSSLVLTMTLSIYSMMMNLKGSSVGVERVLELSDL